MRAPAAPAPRVLALDPMSRGFGFAVLEGPAALVDWGIRNAANDNPRALVRKIRELVSLYHPDVIVIEDFHHDRSRRQQRVRAVIAEVAALATQETTVQLIPATLVRSLFGGKSAVTKHQIATLVIHHFPELAQRLPPVRKPWMPEDARFAIFDAAAFGLTYCLMDDTDASADRKPLKNAA